MDWIFLVFLGGLGGFLVICPNILNFILLSEIIWISLYSIIVIYGAYVDSAILLSWGLFLLCVATAESVVGMSLLMFKFILYHNVRDEYYNNINKTNNSKKLNYTFLHYLND
jgi:NADH:ubiquinone oxidoreductase subunit K